MKILIINGANLDMTGIREKELYGEKCLKSIEKDLIEYVENKGCMIECFQSNSEGEIIDKLHSARENFDAVIINAGAYSHYSYAIRDALVSSELPAVEVHISNVFKREEFRQKSVLAAVCTGYISGLGVYGYKAAIDYFLSSVKA